MSMTLINGHKFEKVPDSFNFGDGLIISMPPCYVLDGETVPEEYFYRELNEQVRKALDRANAKLDGATTPDAASTTLDATPER